MSTLALPWGPRRVWMGAKHRLRLALEVLGRSARYGLLLAGAPLRRDFLILRCMGGNAVSGFFSEFAAVLGALEHYERWKPLYAGLRVEFGAQGLYYDPTYGENWWEYHFEPLDVGAREGARVTVIGDRQHDLFAYRLPRISRRRGFELIDRYIRPNARIRALVETFVREHFAGRTMIGIHYRGTDKHEDAPRVSYETVREAVLDAIAGAHPARCEIFLATDEQAFLDYMRAQFPGRVHCLDMVRSVDGGPIDVIPGNNFKKGTDAVLDCLLLSRCDFLIRTASNLSLCSILFNPHLPEISLNREQ